MEFFSHFYLENHMYLNDYLRYTLIFVVLIVLLFAVSQYLRRHIDIKYRDLSIIALLLFTPICDTQYLSYSERQSFAADTSRMIDFLDALIENQKVKEQDTVVNSTRLSNGMTISIKSQYCEVHFNQDFSTYTLMPTNLVDSDIKLIDKEQQDTHMETYSLLAFKLLIGISGLILQINLSGRGSPAPISAMDQVQSFVLGSIIGGVIYSDSVGLLQLFLVLILRTPLILDLKFIRNHNRWVKSVVDDKSVWIIVNGKTQAEECMKNGISAHDLMFELRAAGIYEISVVKRAAVEQNGQLTVIQYGDESLHYPLATDGQVDPDILEIIKRGEGWLQRELDRLHLEASQVYIGEHVDGKLVAHPYSS